MRSISLSCLGVLLALALLAPASADASRRVPFGWAGAVVDGPTSEPSVSRSEIALMARSGVESVSGVFAWSQMQPSKDGPIDFSRQDALVRAAAERGLRVLPVVVYTPGWDGAPRDDGVSPPLHPDNYAKFVAALAHRYGPHGSFWSANSDLRALPIREWQIWNEPNIDFYWPQPFASGYVQLLRSTRPRLKDVDPHAKLVLAGLTNDSWKALGQIYSAGGRGLFDAVALHPYTRQVSGVPTILKKVRSVMASHGDSKMALLLTELSWSSGQGKPGVHSPVAVTEKKQAENVRDVYAELASVRTKYRIESVYWYTWASTDSGSYSFSYSGLRRFANGKFSSKPAFGEFRKATLALEGCAKKGTTASQCTKKR